MNKLSFYFQSFGFAGQDLEVIVNAFTSQIFTKNDYFVKEGQQSKYLAFIESGLFQYFITADSEERTTYIATEGNFLASLLSFLNEVPTSENIKAIDDGIIWKIDKSQLQKLQEQVTGFKNFYIKLLEWQLCCVDKSRLDLLMLTSEQRYEKMLREEPRLLQQIPLQYLASIIGVTPRHLSRIRNKIR